MAKPPSLNRGGSAQKSGRRLRWGVAAAFLVLALLSARDALAWIAVAAAPATAASLAPGNGVVSAAAAQEVLISARTPQERARAVGMARRALRSDPTATDALTVLGLDAQARGRTEEARQVFSYSLKLSRRELQPRLWSIEEAVTRGDIPTALRSYDIAARTARESHEILFPILNAALREPVIRAELTKLMKTQPTWEDDFLDTAANSTADPKSTATFFGLAAQQGAIDFNKTRQSAIIRSLVTVGDFKAAWGMYLRLHQQASATRSRDSRFIGVGAPPTPFDWSVGTQQELSASLGTARRPGLDFALPGGVGGTIVTQHQMLSSGTYRLDARIIDISPFDARLAFSLQCADGRTIGTLERLGKNLGTTWALKGEFVVPANCTTQVLSLSARPNDDPSGVSGSVTFAQLLRL